MQTEQAPVEKFAPTNGEVLGWGSIAALAALLVVAVVSEPNLVGTRVALGIALAMVLVWAVLLRPRAAAYPETLVLRNMVSDTHLPLAEVEEVTVRHTLNVWVGDKRYACAGIGRSSRQMLRRATEPDRTLFGSSAPRSPRLGEGGSADPRLDYPRFVETRIDELAKAARSRGGAPPRVRRVWAVPEIAALSVLGAALLVSLAV
jgi:hypothetical protein